MTDNVPVSAPRVTAANATVTSRASPGARVTGSVSDDASSDRKPAEGSRCSVIVRIFDTDVAQLDGHRGATRHERVAERCSPRA